MATGQNILDLMEVLNGELQLQTGEADVTRGLRAVNAAQDFFEAELAKMPEVLGDQTGTISTTAATETSTFPSGLIRVDRLQFLDSSTSLPVWDLEPLARPGDHVYSRRWPFNLTSTLVASGRPMSFATKGRTIFWSPIPDAAYTIRYYGLESAADITAAGTFAYPDAVMLPLASFAVRLLKAGVDDPTADAAALAKELFGPVIEALDNLNDDGGRPFIYRYFHET